MRNLPLLFIGALLFMASSLAGGSSVSSASADILRCDATAVGVPGYAGSTVENDAGTAPTIHLWLTTRDDATESAALDALREACPDRYSSTEVVVHHAKHTLAQLQEWNTTATSMMGPDGGVTLSNVDVERNGIVVGVNDIESNESAVTADLRARGVPSEALHVVEASIRQTPADSASPLTAVVATAGALTMLIVLGALLSRRTIRRRG